MASVGENVTETFSASPGASVAAELPTVNPVGGKIEDMVTGSIPLFVIVSRDVILLPTGTEPKSRLPESRIDAPPTWVLVVTATDPTPLGEPVKVKERT